MARDPVSPVDHQVVILRAHTAAERGSPRLAQAKSRCHSAHRQHHHAVSRDVMDNRNVQAFVPDMRFSKGRFTARIEFG